MIDLKRVRENPEAVRESQRARGEDPALVDELLAADEARRSAIQKADELRSEQKAFGKKIGQAAPEDRPALLEGSNELKARVKEAEAEEAAAQEKLEKLQYSIANMIEGAPAGGEEDFVVLEHVGEVPEFDFEVKDHLDLGEALGIIDMKRGTKVGGARFYYLAGDGAWLQLGMLMLAAQKAREAGFKLMVPPVLVRPDVMQGTGFLDEHDEEIYYLERDDMYLVGTSEVALAGLHQDEIIDLSEGPLLYAGWSSCFRREAGSYGKDTKGILRVHQFDKLEMFAYCKPEDAEEMHQKLLGLEREMLGAVEVPYRIIDTAAGLSDSVLTFCQAAQDTVVVVCDEPASITDAYALIKLLNRDYGISRFRVLANMAHAPQEGRNLFAKLTKVTERFLDVALQYVGAVPYDEAVRKAVQKQRAVYEAYPRSKCALAFKAIAQKVDSWPLPANPRGHLEFFVERLVQQPTADSGV